MQIWINNGLKWKQKREPKEQNYAVGGRHTAEKTDTECDLVPH